MDSVNGHSLYPTGGKRLRCAVSRSTDHFAFWTDARQSLRRMYYQAEGSEERIRPPSLVNWMITIKCGLTFNGIVDIFEMLECGNVNILKCRWLNQDPIENFFGQIRQQGIRDTNPTCNHFKNHFKTLLINNFSSRHSMSSNCEDDETKNVILAVKKIVTQDVVIPTTTDLGTFSVHIPPQRMTYMSKVSLGYVSGFMTKYVKKYISACANCKGSIFSENPVDEWHDLIRAKDKVSLPLNCPNHGNSLNGILINKFIAFICYNWTVGINRTLSGKDLRCSNNDPIIQQAREIYLKHRRHRKSRANISRDIIIEYFNNLKDTLKDVPACNVFNYDETNVQDDPGKQKMLFRRGTILCLYPEGICNFTKTATSIMMCGSASGVLLPPYIIYKAEKMWQQWTELGPKDEPCCNDRCCDLGSRYNRTHHGWIDAQTFTD
nr:unnamed protein product [Callosobruchus chinensis]